MAAHELPGRAVKVTLTRQQIFSLSGDHPILAARGRPRWNTDRTGRRRGRAKF
jgi:hypothetical protein